VTEPAKNERAKSEAVQPKSTMLIVQVLWACHAFNATPEQAAKRVVTDLFEHLSRGGSVSVHVTSSDGREHTLDVVAESRRVIGGIRPRSFQLALGCCAGFSG